MAAGGARTVVPFGGNKKTFGFTASPAGKKYSALFAKPFSGRPVGAAAVPLAAGPPTPPVPDIGQGQEGGGGQVPTFPDIPINYTWDVGQIGAIGSEVASDPWRHPVEETPVSLVPAPGPPAGVTPGTQDPNWRAREDLSGVGPQGGGTTTPGGGPGGGGGSDAQDPFRDQSRGTNTGTNANPNGPTETPGQRTVRLALEEEARRQYEATLPQEVPTSGPGGTFGQHFQFSGRYFAVDNGPGHAVLQWNPQKKQWEPFQGNRTMIRDRYAGMQPRAAQSTTTPPPPILPPPALLGSGQQYVQTRYGISSSMPQTVLDSLLRLQRTRGQSFMDNHIASLRNSHPQWFDPLWTPGGGGNNGAV